MHKYRLIAKKGEGTFSEVLKAQSIASGKYVAIKCMKNHFDSIDQVNNLREIQALRRLAGHPNIIKLHEVLYDEPTGRLALVFELMDMNLYEAIKGRRHYLPDIKTKQYMYELLKALDHMHRNGIFHRDVKPENLLLSDDEIKLADLGSCRGIYSRQPYTEYISTRWYRAPECLLTDGFYNFKMDIFAAGCVWFEIVALFPLFPGQNEMDQIQKIHNVLGTPDPELLARKFKRNASHMDFNFPEKRGTGIERLVPHADPGLVEVMKKLIRYDPDERILARQALKDSYFRELRDAEKGEKERGSGKGEETTSAGASAGAGGASELPPPPHHRRGGGGGDHRTLPPQPSYAAPVLPGKAGISESSSATSVDIGHGDEPEITRVASRSVSPSADDHKSATLPTINKEQRRKADRRADRDHNDNTASLVSLGGGGGSEVEDIDGVDGTMLPPIGGIKAKRDNKQTSKTRLKAGGVVGGSGSLGAALGGGPGNSKGFGGGGHHALGSTGLSSMSSTGAVSSNQFWGGGVKEPESTRHVAAAAAAAAGPPTPPGGADSHSSGAAIEKMSSTWHVSQRNKYVSPFPPKGSKKR
jgi:renal tumor antigen